MVDVVTTPNLTEQLYVSIRGMGVVRPPTDGLIDCAQACELQLSVCPSVLECASAEGDAISETSRGKPSCGRSATPGRVRQSSVAPENQHANSGGRTKLQGTKETHRGRSKTDRRTSRPAALTAVLQLQVVSEFLNPRVLGGGARSNIDGDNVDAYE